MDLLFQIRGDDHHEYLITFSVAIIKQLHSLHFLKLQSVHNHRLHCSTDLYQLLWLSKVIFYSSNFRPKPETVLWHHFMFFHCITSKSQTKTGVPCEAPGIPLQPEEAAKQSKANFSPPRRVSHLSARRNYEINRVLAPQDVYSQLAGQHFVLLLLPSLHKIRGWEGPAFKISWESPSFLSRRATPKEPTATEKRNPTITKWPKSHPYKLMEETAIKSY